MDYAKIVNEQKQVVSYAHSHNALISSRELKGNAFRNWGF